MDIQFKALNDKTRRNILELLKHSDLTAGDISEQFNMSKPSISHHLDLLKQAELVRFKKKGQYMLYSINLQQFDDILLWMNQFKNDSITEKPRFRIPLNQ
jgi:ArsR family transcriptional regulator, arsenate/arsenite/antimonite-responsive transcriptional repressor